jgi:hypothetical protein
MRIHLGAALLFLPITGWPFNFSTMESDRWYEVTPTFDYKGRPGAYQSRDWCTLRYNPDNQSLYFYEGFSSGDYCIYANALYEFFPDSANNRVDLVNVSSWTCSGGGTGPFFADQSGGRDPRPRHTYSQFAYAPSSRSVYMINGSMGVSHDGHFSDFWKYSVAASSWSLLGFTPFTDNAPPMEAPAEYTGAPEAPPMWLRGKENIYDQNLFYHAPTNEIYFFYTMQLYYKPNVGRTKSPAIYAYSLTNRSWRTVFEAVADTAPNPIPPLLGAHGAYDGTRNQFVFYSSSGDRLLHSFNPSNGAWSLLANTAGSSPAPRGFGSLEYIASRDLFVYAGESRDVWVYDPVGQSWRDITPTPLPASWPPATGSYYWSYDPAHDVLVHFNSDTQRFWFYRFASSFGSPSGEMPSQPRRLRNP